MELDYDWDSESLLLTDYSQLDETKSLLVFPEVSDVGSVSVCYYGTNETSLENVDRLQVYFVVYEPSEENVNLTQPPQSISQTLRNSKMCMPTEVKNSYNAALQFGAFIPSDCFVNCDESNICPLKLDFFSKSCMMLIGTTLEEMFRKQSVLRNQILKHVINMEEVCVDLNIRIETPGNIFGINLFVFIAVVLLFYALSIFKMLLFINLDFVCTSSHVLLLQHVYIQNLQPQK